MKPPRREDILSIIASPCLLRNDRAGRALFISDFKRRAPDAPSAAARLEAAGYLLFQVGGLTLIDWPRESYAAFYEELPPPSLPDLSCENGALWGLCRILMQHDAAVARQDIETLAEALRLARLDKTEKLIRLLRGALAEALRLKQPPPCHAARILSLILNQQTEQYIGR